MSAFDIVFWLLIALIAVLAYVIESGLSARHRTLVLSSILSATGAAIFMMFWVEDNTKFATGKQASESSGEKTKQTVIAVEMGEGQGLPEVEVIKGKQPDFIDSVTRYEDDPLFKKPGGFRDCPACPLMTKIPAGDFAMGSPDTEHGRRSNEGPQKLIRHKRPFAVSRYEIQYGEFAAFVKSARHHVKASCTTENGTVATWLRPGVNQATAQHPVVCLSRDDVDAYAKWLSGHADRTYRLPSESEWEYIACGMTTSAYWTGGSISMTEANFGEVRGGTTPGGKYKENPFKLFDTAGNVWEMTADCWNDNLGKIPTSGVADLGHGDCDQFAIRGGAWNSPATKLRSAYRRPLSRKRALSTVGFRLVREIK